METKNKNSVPGLFMFLIKILELIKQGESETCTKIEDNISKGISGYLSKKYYSTFKDTIGAADTDSIDEFYKDYIGVANGSEDRYFCDENDGLYLLIAIALNKIC